MTEGAMHHHHPQVLTLTHPYSLYPWQRNIALKLVFRWRTSRLGALVAAAGSITTSVRVFLPTVVVHVEKQRDHVNDVNMKKHHHYHKVGAGAHAALVAGEALARLTKRQGRASGRSRVLSSSILGFLVVSHLGWRSCWVLGSQGPSV